MKLCWLLALVVFTGAAHARLVEEQFDVPVEVRNRYGKEVRQSIRVTVFRDDANPQPMPVLVLNHGRAVDAAGRAGLRRARYSDASRWFAGWGFIVAVPTRVGYGISGGEDVEASGQCARRMYAPGYEAAAVQTLAVLAAMRARPDTAKDRAVIVGQSYGGATSAAIAAKNQPGVAAAINFAGGGGGDPKGHPGQPCSPRAMESLFRDYGRTGKVPMLWVYTQNDLFMGPTHPREWFDAYAQDGAPAQFIQFPPHGEDGHALFTRGPDVWQPAVAAFLRAQGFEDRRSKGQP